MARWQCGIWRTGSSFSVACRTKILQWLSVNVASVANPFAALRTKEFRGIKCKRGKRGFMGNGLLVANGASEAKGHSGSVAKGLQWHGGNAAYGVPVAVLVLRVAPRSYSGLVSTWHLWQIHLLH